MNYGPLLFLLASPFLVAVNCVPTNPDGISVKETPSLPLCVYYHNRSNPSAADEELFVKPTSISDDNGELIEVNVTVCTKPSDFCYTLWTEQQDSAPVILSQGCWESSRQHDCEKNTCASFGRPSQVLHQSRFCCCSGHMCNFRVQVDDSDYVNASYAPADSLSEPAASSEGVVIFATICVVVACLGVIVIAGSLLVLRQLRLFNRQCRKTSFSSSLCRPLHDDANEPLLAGLPESSVSLTSVTGQGRYGTVWKGYFSGKQVAVKVFTASSKCFFENERDIYSLPFMDHPNLISYLGYQEFSNIAGHVEYRIVLELAPHGCLQDYLRQNSVDWPTLCKMGFSVASGLAHLHTKCGRTGDLSRQSIAHRDVNSRNILVKADLSCCLCDFGFAMQVEGSHYVFKGEEQLAEVTSLSDVGTLRYMAPEVLEGAVNLRDCESSLKQIDVYALGLVLWEIAYRCSDLYPTREAPAYRLPFENELGSHPTLDQMKNLVCRHKARPLIPETWRAGLASIRLLTDTLEDAWDVDAEARLTSLCIEERWAELPVLWERERHKGFSPNLRVNVNGQRHKNESNRVTGITNLEAVGNMKNQSANWPPSPRLLQPHQGRNPCMERNMRTASAEDMAVGNSLMGSSNKTSLPMVERRRPVDTGATHSVVVAETRRIIPPIEYVHNVVREHSDPGQVNRDAPLPAPEPEPSKGVGTLLSGLFRGSRPSKKNHPAANHEEEARRQHSAEVPASSCDGSGSELAKGDQSDIKSGTCCDNSSNGLVRVAAGDSL